jgi:hypothetical protein
MASGLDADWLDQIDFNLFQRQYERFTPEQKAEIANNYSTGRSKLAEKTIEGSRSHTPQLPFPKWYGSADLLKLFNRENRKRM